MRTYDISLTLSNDMPTWPGDPKIALDRISKMEDGDHANVTQISASLHTGTHVDAPFHFLGGDAATVDALPLSLLTGRAYVLHLPDEVDLITAAVLERADIPPRTRRLLFRTRNSSIWARGEKTFQTDYVSLSVHTASAWWEWIISRLRPIKMAPPCTPSCSKAAWSRWKGSIFLRWPRAVIRSTACRSRLPAQTALRPAPS